MVETKSTMSPKVSVIVPVYKAENYINRCVDSILAQTFTDWELLLIDDGSPDNSGSICDEYSRKDQRIRVFHKKNGGVSSARQKGLEEALGEYTIHADPDDWVEPSMLEKLYGKAKEDNADMVICDFIYQYHRGGVISKQTPQNTEAETVLRQLLFQQLHGSCCNKLVRRSCYSTYDINFPKNIICWEDLYVICSLLTHPMKVSYLPEAFYHYDCVTNENSIVRKQNIDALLSQMRFIEHFEELGYSDDILYPSKRGTKRMAFESGLLSAKGIKALYSEVNETIIHDKFDFKSIGNRGVQCLIRGRKLMAHFYKFLFLVAVFSRGIQFRRWANTILKEYLPL